MPAITANARNFLINSDYPIDQIIYIYSGSVLIPAFDFNDVTIPHGLPFTPLPMGQWSTTSDFSVSYEISSGPLGGTPYTVNTGIEANATNIIFSNNNNTGSPITVYYRIYAFQPSNASGDSPHTKSQDADFIFSSDYNYTKLLSSGVTGTLGAGAATAVTHSLGYYPQVMAWKEKTGVITPLVFAGLDGGGHSAQVTTTTVLFTASTSDPSSLFHYRIYLDD